jgi:uncharacterized protein YbjT (DUF2867 family)
MAHVLVTGGTGALGRPLVRELVAVGHRVRVMSRRGEPADRGGAPTWAQADLSSGEGLAAAVAGVDTIVHAASQPFGATVEVDVQGTRRLLAAARLARIRHLIYVSIVGIDHVPLAYYRHKLTAEAIVMQGPVRWSIQRATQFHPFLNVLLRRAAQLPVLLLPTDLRVQPVDPAEVAVRLRALVEAGPAGRADDFGGPEVLSVGEAAQSWRTAYGLRRPLVHIPLPGALARALRRGDNTCPKGRAGVITWARWLADAAAATGAAD